LEKAKRSEAVFVRLAALKDLGRLACAMEIAPLPIFRFPNGDVSSESLLAVQVDLYLGNPIFYYVSGANANSYLGYKVSSFGEEILPVPAPSIPGYAYAPVINVKRLPAGISPASSSSRRFQRRKKLTAVEVEDLASLARIAAYKLVYEESPLPVFSYKGSEEHIMGTFARMDEYEESSIFFYFKQRDSPAASFIKYSISKPSEVTFTSRTDEHGNVLIKIINLAEKHPIVDLRYSD
jgi:hypothetical protein